MKLIFDSGKFWDFKFLKIENWKKGGQVPVCEPLQWLCKKYDFLPKKRLSNVRMMLCMVGTNVLEWCPPLLHPLSCTRLQHEKCKIFTFFEHFIMIWKHPESPAPLFYFWKVPTICYKFCIYDFPQKCFVFCVQTHVLKTNQLLAYAMSDPSPQKRRVLEGALWSE